MKIYELKISDNLFDETPLDELSDYSGISEIALVENPAIETEWVYMSKQEFESYTDYPQYMSDAAQVALNYIEESGNPNDCMTQTGKVRAQQLAQKKPVSLETLKRMKSYISRHMVDLDSSTSYDDGCGKLAMAAWGCRSKNECNAALKWLDRKITTVEEEFITPNPCQSGYEAIGTKMLNGRRVPNCVPLRASKPNKFDAVVDLNGVPLYKTESEADTEAAKMGCSGSHPHEYEGETLYMPCANHAEATHLWDDNSTEELSMEEKGVELDELLENGWTISDSREIDDEYKEELIEKYRKKVNNNYTSQEFYRIVSSPNEPSVMDTDYRKIRYIYVVGPGQGSPIISTSRDFCKNMVGRKQLVYRFEDIQSLNVQLNAEDGDRKIIPRPAGTSPDIFRWHGGANCRHIWVELFFNVDDRIPKTATRGKRKAEMEMPAPGGSGQVNPKVAKQPQSFSHDEDREMIEGVIRLILEVDDMEERKKVAEYAIKDFMNEGVSFDVEDFLTRINLLGEIELNQEQDKPVVYQYGLPVYELEEVAVWKSEMMGCKGSYDEIDYQGKKHYRPCKYVSQESKFKEQFNFKQDDEKRMIYSPAMIPDRMIPRIDEVTREKYFVYFTKDTIENISQKFLMEKRINNTNLEHTNLKYDDIYMVESWIVTSDLDKAYSLGFTRQEVPIGSWMVAYKVNNDKVWNEQIKKGKVKGLSVEGEFELVQQSFSNDEYLYNEIINILKKTE
jgi:hypothetical protein